MTTTLPSPPTDVISSLHFCPSGSLLAVGSWDCKIHTYILTDGSWTPSAAHPTRAPILDLCFGDSDNLIYFVGLDRDVRSLNLDNDEQSVLSTHEKASNKIAYSAAHGLLISTAWDGTMHIHDLETGQVAKVALTTKPFGLALTEDKCVVAMAERKVSIYTIQSLRDAVDGRTADPQPWQRRESSLKFMTRAIAAMPNGTGFVTSSIEGRVAVDWFDEGHQSDAYAFKCHRQTESLPSSNGVDTEEVDLVYPVNAIVFHPSLGTFATGGGDGVVASWDANTKRRIKNYSRLAAGVTSMCFTPDGTVMAVGISPTGEDGMESESVNPDKVQIVMRTLGPNDFKGRTK
ncbi:WD40 repeat-like protein [Piedraia hortae CBS 480.64]|uniref:WD40 repeat-like protein n=1 Tax=Piedraia hortae CBS 480.64 TaxID=1314780 RepID=A0A6A7BTM1_9PEZI|nr:WD40 repeat-like protein [Piedraia hortae CBS 480.64]